MPTLSELLDLGAQWGRGVQGRAMTLAELASPQAWQQGIAGLPAAMRQASTLTERYPLTAEATNNALNNALSFSPGILGTTLYHGGRLLANPIADKQGVLLNGIPALSTSARALEAARYAVHNSGSLNAINATQMNIYRKGMDRALDEAYAAGDWKKFAEKGFDGMDLRSFGHSGNEVVLFDAAKAAANKIGEAARKTWRTAGDKFFEPMK